MQDVPLIISSLEKKVKELVKRYSELKGRNTAMETELTELRKTVDSQKEVVKNLEDKNKIIKLAKSLADSNPDTAAMKYKINELVREIDKCIAQMNS
jgi:predicted RNase H-like nuclease (RuvC/YqgF family)